MNSSPDGSFDRFAIDFGNLSLDQAAGWPDLLERVERLVKPERAQVRSSTGMGGHGKKYWWQFTARRDPLYAAIAPLKRCLVTARVTKHLCLSFQPTDRVLNEKIYVFAFEHLTPFAVLQSRFHISWAWSRAPAIRANGSPSYSASDCFETFPFPHADPRTIFPALEASGQRLYDFRAKYMVDENVGLTITYNRLKDPACADARVLELRRLHEEMDRAVIAAYAEGDPAGRWLDVEVPPYCPMRDAETANHQKFEGEVIDRLFALNAKRAEEERGATSGGTATKKRAPKRAKKAEPNQLSMTRDPRGTSG